MAPPSKPALVNVASAPQQANSYDCGMYVLALARQLSAWHAAGEDVLLQEGRLGQEVTPGAVRQLRQEVLALVEGKMKAGPGV